MPLSSTLIFVWPKLLIKKGGKFAQLFTVHLSIFLTCNLYRILTSTCKKRKREKLQKKGNNCTISYKLWQCQCVLIEKYRKCQTTYICHCLSLRLFCSFLCICSLHWYFVCLCDTSSSCKSDGCQSELVSQKMSLSMACSYIAKPKEFRFPCRLPLRTRHVIKYLLLLIYIFI